MQANHVDRKASPNTPSKPGKKSRLSRAIGLGIVAAVGLAGAGFGAVGCLSRPLCEPDCHPHTTNLYVSTVEQTSVDKIDLLFMIDNSSSMADKQRVLQDAVPDLVNRLVSPNCVIPSADPNVPPTVTTTPADPDAPCPTAGAEREFTPIRNIHIGVISSSLGGHGSTTLCATTEPENDHGELMGSRPRYLASATKAPSPPLDAQGFLDWHPAGFGGTQDIVAFNDAFRNMVVAPGQDGCGFEAQLEAIYRFLADPAPPQDVVLQPCSAGSTAQCAVKSGLDQKLLDQRAAFLRPDSLLAVIMLTDENDCSIRDDGQNYYAAGSATLSPGSAQCDTNPNDPCCFSCGLVTKPAGCADTCAGRPVTDTTKQLRCYREKQRFGVDFLYPTQRYVNALSLPNICTSNPTLDPNEGGGCPDSDNVGGADIAKNPIYAGNRSTSLVFFAGIIGVPWQDIATPTSGATSGTPLAYLTAKQINDGKVWDQILGNLANPAGPVEPTDPHMIEATAPRGGIPGINGTLMEDPKNGHEYANSTGRDLMYACVFQLATSINCANSTSASCDCSGATPIADHSPLCQADNTTYDNTQRYAKGYPGQRELQVLKDFGDNSIVASICARNLRDNTSPDYGYRPAVTAIIDRLKDALQPKCLPRQLIPVNGVIPCSIIEASPGSATCDPAKGRSDVTNQQVIDTAKARLKSQGVCDVAGHDPCSSFSFCQIDVTSAAAGNDTICHTQPTVPVGTTPGWCYVDPALQPTDNAALVAKCPSTQKHVIRFIDPAQATPAAGAYALIACFGAPSGGVSVAPVGDGG